MISHVDSLPLARSLRPERPRAPVHGSNKGISPRSDISDQCQRSLTQDPRHAFATRQPRRSARLQRFNFPVIRCVNLARLQSRSCRRRRYPELCIESRVSRAHAHDVHDELGGGDIFRSAEWFDSPAINRSSASIAGKLCYWPYRRRCEGSSLPERVSYTPWPSPRPLEIADAYDPRYLEVSPLAGRRRLLARQFPAMMVTAPCRRFGVDPNDPSRQVSRCTDFIPRIYRP